VEDFRSEEYCRVGKVPVPPKKKVHTIKVEFFCGLEELLDFPQIDTLSEPMDLLKCM